MSSIFVARPPASSPSHRPSAAFLKIEDAVMYQDQHPYFLLEEFADNVPGAKRVPIKVIRQVRKTIGLPNVD